MEANELINTTSSESNKAQNECSECSKTFTSPNDFKQHFELCCLNNEITASTAATNYNTINPNEVNDDADGGLKEKILPNEVLNADSKTHSNDEQLTENTETLKTLAGYNVRKAEMFKNLAKVEKDAVTMEAKDICFCCDESYDTFHLGQIQCSYCRKSFKSQLSYERHIFITHSEIEDYPCNICNAKMRSKTLLKLHAEQHQNRGTPFACKDCGKEFKREYDCRRHRKYSVCGQNDKNAFSCKNCDKKFNYLPSLREHMKKNCGTTVSNKPRHKCSICEKTFSSLCDLDIHATVHSDERPFECDVCGKKFKRLRLLRNHRILHTNERPFICDVCGLTFKTKRLKDRHMRRHISEPVHPCDECGRKFFQMSELRTHLKQHIKPYECDMCDDKFKTEKILQRHLKRVHRRRKVAIKQKKELLNKRKRACDKADTNDRAEDAIVCKIEENSSNENEFITNDEIVVSPKVYKIEDESSNESEIITNDDIDDMHLTTNIIPAQVAPKTQEVHRQPLPGYDLRKAEMLKNLDQIETDAIAMESNDICFCCNENYVTCHSGHIKCSDCRKSFKSEISYERHIFIIHSESNDFPCTICIAKLRSANLLKLHIEQHQNRGKPFSCKVCGNEFSREYEWKYHLRYTVCGQGDTDAFKCKQCNKIFKYAHNLRKHTQKHYGILSANRSKHICMICEKTFSYLSDLKAHATVHSEERPFECDLCDKKFKRLRFLRSHRMYHTNERPFTCKVCNRSFKVKYERDRHMRRHTDKQPLHDCDECGIRFVKLSELKNHYKRTHLNAYECGVCNKKFKTEKTLERHVKCIHSTNKYDTHEKDDANPLIICKLEADLAIENEFITNDAVGAPSKIYKLEDDESSSEMKFSIDIVEDDGGAHIQQFNVIEIHCTSPKMHPYDGPELNAITIPARTSAETQEKQIYPLAINQICKADMLNNLDKIEKEAIILEKEGVCFCCNESYDTCHFGIIKCCICRKSFKSQSSHDRHAFMIHSEFNDFPCTICNAKMRSENLLKLHMEQHRNRGMLYACKVCGKDFGRESNWKFHQKYSVCGQNDADAFKCKICNRKFIYSINLRTHMRKHFGTYALKKRKYMCHVCKKTFIRLFDLKEHAAAHTDKCSVESRQGGNIFKQSTCLRVHRKLHCDDKPYTCQWCRRSFRMKYQRDRHTKRHTDEPVHVCDICDKKFIVLYELKTHQTRAHGTTYDCDVCNEKFNNEKKLKLHTECGHNIEKINAIDNEEVLTSPKRNRLAADSSTDNKLSTSPKVHKLQDDLSNAMDIIDDDDGAHLQFKEVHMCRICKKIFTKPADLKIHAETHSEERPFECDSCDKKFKRVGDFRRHRIIHTDQRPHTCEVCNLSFKMKFQRDRHMKRHTDEPVHVCDECGKGFVILYELNSHQKRTHGKSYECDACNEKFKTEQTLKVHIECVHNSEKTNPNDGEEVVRSPKHRKTENDLSNAMDIVDVDDGVHVHEKELRMCPICKKSFTNLKVHAITHSEERPFECNSCYKKFKRVGDLRKHRIIHTKQKPYPCKLCNRSFRMKFQRDRHMKRHTDEPVHICNECGKGFVILYELNSHQKRAHGNSYECDTCNEKFKTKKKLENHNFIIHSVTNTLWNNVDTFKCTEYEATFSTKEDCNGHLEKECDTVRDKKKQSTSEYSTKCNDCVLCDKNFDNSSLLQSHLLVDHDTDPEDYID